MTRQVLHVRVSKRGKKYLAGSRDYKGILRKAIGEAREYSKKNKDKVGWFPAGFASIRLDWKDFEHRKLATTIRKNPEFGNVGRAYGGGLSWDFKLDPSVEGSPMMQSMFLRKESYEQAVKVLEKHGFRDIWVKTSID